MNKKRFLIIFSAAVLIVAAVFVILHFREQAQWITFAECEAAGGEAWRVDLFHPDICPNCAAYRECESSYNDFTEECPMCYGPCEACLGQYDLFEDCPECHTTCRECENEHLHDFEDEAERFALCPDCKVCEDCREEVNEKMRTCQPCIECEACKEEHKRYEDIQDVCPEVIPCMDCMEGMGMFPEKCPGGKEKLGNISDAAMWFTCCR